MRADRAALQRLFAGHHRALLGGLFASIAQALVLLPIGLLVQRIFADYIPDEDTSAILLAGGTILVLYVLSALLSLGSRRLVLGVTVESTERLRSRVLRRLHELPVAWHEHHGAAEIQAQIAPQAERVEAIANPLVTLGQAAIVGPPLIVLAIVISPLLAVMVFVVVPALVAVGILTRRRVIPRVRTWLRASQRFDAHVQLALHTMPFTRARSADDIELAHGEALAGELRRTALAKYWSQNVFSIAQGAVAAVAGALILIVGSVAVARGDLELADLLAFYAVIGLLLRHVAGGSSSVGVIFTGLESLRRLEAILDDPTPSPYDAGEPPRVDGTLALRGVTFGHADDPVVHEVDVEVRPGERVALTGPNGSGKSTVASLLLGLHRPWSGHAEAGGAPYDDIDVTELRRHIGYVSQEPMLRPGTVADNIAFGRPQADQDAVGRAGKLAGVADMDVDLGDDGIGLSGGERQRVALARALVCDPPVLILDEPTNHLDTDAVTKLMTVLDGLDPAPAILVITHEPRLIGWADRVVRLEAGRVVSGAPAT